MSIPLMSLPGYQTGNTLLNFEPIQRALDQKIRMDQVQQEQQFRQQRADKSDARDDEMMMRQRGEAFGNKALAFASLPAEQRDPAAWDRILKDHPDYANLPAQYRDPMKSPDLVAAEFGKFRERSAPRDNLRVVGDSLLRVEPGQQPQVLYQKPREKSTLERLMEMEGVQSNPQPSAPRQYQPMPQTGGPRIQPQASVGEEVMPGGVTLASDPVEIPQPNASASSPQRPTERMFDIPLFGQKTESEARKLAFKLIAGDPEARALGQAINNMLGPQSNPAGLQSPTLNAIEEKQFNTTESLSRLNNIASQFRPEFQTIEDRVGFAWTEFKDKFRAGRTSIAPEQQQELANFAAYRGDALNNLNQYIKEITGAAMTNAEAERIMRAMPNPGQGILDGDSPTVFKAKLDAAIRTSKLALARYNYLRKNGFSGTADDASKQVPLERMNGVIQQRTNAIAQEISAQNPGVGIEQLKPVIRQRLRAEFGIDA